MPDEKMRDEFEEWYRRDVMRDAPEDVAAQRFGKDRNGMYWDIWTRRSWQAWQASRAALVIELPAEVDRAHFNDESMSNGYNYAVDDCREAVEAAGVRVKE